jgi:Lrp/AsnC family transcriptional regulator, leucine-responsive regulatory protein
MYALDELDYRILTALQEDATISNQALAKRVFASAATSLRRVRALTEAGVIERSVAIVSPEKLGHMLLAICEITLAEQNAEAFEAFERLVLPATAITQCYRTAPTVDFTLMLTLRNMPEYSALAQRLFTANNNVRNVRTRFATKRSKFNTVVPLPALP